MPEIQVRENQFEVALRRFKRACEKAGIMTKLRSMEFHEKRTSKRRREKLSRVKRLHKKSKKEMEFLSRNRAKKFNFSKSDFLPKTETSQPKAEPKETTTTSSEE